MKKSDSYEERISEAFNQVLENYSERMLWRSIPIVRGILNDLNEAVLLNLEGINSSDRESFCKRVLKDELIPVYDVPRLALELASYTKACRELKSKLEAFVDIENVPMDRLEPMLGRHLKFDPVERTPEWEECIYDVESECESILKDEPRGMGFCFPYWNTKTLVLAGKGIKWKSPSRMNPGVIFD